MAFYDTYRPAGTRLHRAVGAIMSEIAAWRHDAEARRTLSRLSEFELNDIGLSRSGLSLSEHDAFRDS